MNLLNRLAGFGVVSLVSSCAPLLILPAVSHNSSRQEWIAFGVGQTVGTFIGFIGMLGFAVEGTALAASANPRQRKEVYKASLKPRCWAFVAGASIGCTLMFVLLDTHRLLACAMVVSGAFNALSLAWFVIGTADFKSMLWFDAIPRVGASVIGIFGLVRLETPVIYPISSIVLLALCLLLFQVKLDRETVVPHSGSAGRSTMSNPRSTAAISMLSVGISNAPVPIGVALLAPAEVSLLIAADRLFRLSLITLTLPVNVLQPWLIERQRNHNWRERDRSLALGAMTVLGFVGAVSFSLLGPSVVEFVFGRSGPGGQITMILYGGLFFLAAVNTAVIRFYIIPAGGARIVLRAMLFALLASSGILGLVPNSVSIELLTVALVSFDLITLSILTIALIRGRNRYFRASPA